MKYYNPQVLVPWYDYDMKQWMKLTFKGTVDKRRLKREVRKFCQRSFGTQVDDDFMKYDCLYTRPNLDQIMDKVFSDETVHNTLLALLQQEHNDLEQTEADTGNKDQTPS